MTKSVDLRNNMDDFSISAGCAAKAIHLVAHAIEQGDYDEACIQDTLCVIAGFLEIQARNIALAAEEVTA